MDATTATAAAADITAPKTAMLADGVMTTGTGSGGGTPDFVNYITGISVEGITTLPASLDIYVPNLSSLKSAFFNIGSNTCTEIKIKSDVPIKNMEQAFNTRSIRQDCVIKIDADLSQCTTFTRAFSARVSGDNFPNTIVANIDFTSVASNQTYVFGINVVNVTCVPNTLGYNLNIGDASKLSTASIISIANCLKAVSGKTITFNATPKAALSTIMGTVTNNGTYDLFTEDAGGNTSLMNFITTTKGWTVA